jgi:type VI secretion system protein ImpF
MAREEQRPVQQSVLDRLIDTEPYNRGEVPPTRMQSVRALKIAVRRDLEWLLNTRAIPEPAPKEFEEVRQSLYTYGLSDISSLSADDPRSRQKLLNMIEQAITTFEPRLGSVHVSEPGAAGAHESRQMRFMIEAVLRLDPTPEQVVFNTVLNLATGEYAVKGGDSNA